mmetsp:Transcript_6530/g.9603  ORF Transcript_6530/g.9603 Transcript_6530/m.9603 type:complete len:182 (+) Transcript_6530:100-645(+)
MYASININMCQRNSSIKPLLKKRVSFDSKVFVFPVESSSLSSKGFWYQYDDFVSFYKERSQTVNKLKSLHGNVSHLDPAHYCLRGLEEKLSKRFAKERKHQQSFAIRSVLNAQAHQKEIGYINPEYIKSLSIKLSKASRGRAIELAAMDAKACHSGASFSSTKKRPSLVKGDDRSSKRINL